MEIWFVDQYQVAPDMPGGTRHFELGRELAKYGHTVRIFASDFNRSLRRQLKLQPGETYRREAYGDVEFVWVDSRQYTRNDWRRIVNMLTFTRNFGLAAGQVEAATGSPDVIIGSSPHPLSALAAYRAAQRFGSYFVLELRDLWPQVLVDMAHMPEWHPAILYLRRLERFLYARAERIIVLAEGAIPYLTARNVDPNRVVYIPNGAGKTWLGPQRSRAEMRRELGFDRTTIVYAGAHGPANGLETIVRAAKLTEDLDVDFVLVGDGPSKRKLVQLAQELGTSNLRFLDPVDKREIPDILNAADLGLITLRNVPTFAYGISPNKLFEYMATGLPIIASLPGEMADLVERSGIGVVCEPESPSDLARTVRDVSTLSAERRVTMGQRGRRLVGEQFCL